MFLVRKAALFINGPLSFFCTFFSTDTDRDIVKKELLLCALPFALLACRGEADRKGQEGSYPEKEAAVRIGQTATTEQYRETGLEYAMAVQAALGKTLQEKISKEGAPAAIEFCNLNALAITDSLSRELGATISRITDRPRNPQSAASEWEMKYFSVYRKDLAEGHTAKGLVALRENRIHVYYPIVTNNLCLQCHGSPGMEITPEVYSGIKERYPEDRAVGYSAGELRGLWKVAFPEN